MIHIFEYSILNGKKDQRRFTRFVADLKEVDLVRKQLKEKHGHDITLDFINYAERRR
jgi:hypothetical protein